MIRYLTEKNVEQLLTMPLAIELPTFECFECLIC